MSDDFSNDETIIGPLSQEQFMMFIKANSEEAKNMSMDKTSAVVAEGIYRLCMTVGEEIDSFIMNVDAEEMSDLAKTKPGSEMMRLITIFGDSIVMIIESINHLKDNFDEFDKYVKEFRTNVKQRLHEQEESLIKDFVDSIPDSPEDLIN
jgi:hypothetical protein